MIKLNNITKYYVNSKESKAIGLQDVSLNIKEGEFVSIMGKSGSGKSTLLNILGIIDSFDEGNYIFEGKDIKTLKKKEVFEFRNTCIGYIFQSFNLINTISIIENVELPMGYAGIARKERKSRAEKLLDSVGLLGKAYNKPGQLSGGQQQRVAIARALSNNPRIILADEPTGNLDKNSGLEIMNLLKSVNANGTTLILVTHDTDIASSSKRVLEIEDGKIVKDSGDV